MTARWIRPGLAVAGVLAVAVSVGACEDDVEPRVFSTGSPTAAPTPEPTDGPGPPPVASAAPQPDPVEATFGQTATVTSVNLFGTESVTIDVTLAEPIEATENELDSGTVVTPNQGDVFLGLEVTIEGADGVYNFNPLDFHLVPIDDLESWRDEAFTWDAPLAAKGGAWDSGLFAPPLSPTTVAEGARISGYVYFDVPSEALVDAAVVLEAFLMVDGPPAAYWPLD